MEYIAQRHRHSCGATCVAMIAGMEVGNAERLVGVRKTTARQLAAHLRYLGFLVPSTRLTRIGKDDRPKPGDLVRVKWEGILGGHWVVKGQGDTYLDPLPKFGVVTDHFYATKEGRRGKATSFLRVFRVE